MNRKTYTINFGPTWWECQIAIDHDFIFPGIKGNEDWSMERAMQEMILFWTDGDKRLDLNDGDVTKTFLQQLARQIYYILGANNFNKMGLIAEFKNREGWCPMDGSKGIEILEVEEIDISHDEFEVMEDPQS